jgi:hypothetical protein
VRDLLKNFKVYSPGYEATHWGFDHSQVVDLATALAQPNKIAVLPVFFNRPTEFSYCTEFATLDIEKFDLVLFTDIEFRSQAELVAWIETTGATNWLLSVAGLHRPETLGPKTVYMPVWSFNFLRWNTPRQDFPLERPYLFDCLCGTRRKHRDYVMLALQQSGLLDKSIATYRDVFVGGDCTATPDDVQQEFPEAKVLWPYVSPNLDPAWEVGPKLDNAISGIVPWEIYNRTNYSILVETLGYGTTYLMAEKIGKCLFGRRLFVHFGQAHWLSTLKSFGFETFDSVLDESYDDISLVDVWRYRAAFDQVEWLSKQNHPALLQKVRPILDHNHDRLYRFKEQQINSMQDLVLGHLK